MEQRQLDPRRLRDYYASLTDEDLRYQHAQGPAAFATPEVWQIVEAAFLERFSLSASGGDDVTPVATKTQPSLDLSSWFFIGRVFLLRRWNPTDPLPTAYLKFMAGSAVLSHLF